MLIETHRSAFSAAGWPLYLATNASGRPYDRLANHFDPYSPIYSKRERSEIVVSDCALAAVVYGLYRLALAYGLAWLVKVGCSLDVLHESREPAGYQTQ